MLFFLSVQGRLFKAQRKQIRVSHEQFLFRHDKQLLAPTLPLALI